MQQRGINADPAEFFAILNSVYSDYYTVAKKHNVHNIDFYIDSKKAPFIYFFLVYENIALVILDLPEW